MKAMILCMMVAGVLLSTDRSYAADPTIQSGPARTSLLELYTSEGCDACPSAEAWLSRLTEDARLWKEFVPVAFHVSYWNNKSWTDRFSVEKYDARERGYGNLWLQEDTYTPCFALDGKEWKAWRVGKDVPKPAAADAGRLQAVCRDGGDVEILFTPSGKVAPPIRAHVCVLGFGLTSNVTGGENKGRTLAHDFVVRDWQIAPCALSGEAYRGHATITPPQGRSALVVWMSGKGEQTPLQAAGGWLPDRKNVLSTNQ